MTQKVRNWSGIIPGVILLVTLLLTGCGQKLSDAFDKEEVQAAAENMVNQVNAGEMEGIYNDTFAPVMRQAIELEQLNENLEYTLNKLGQFESFEKVAVAGAEDKDTGTPYAVAVVLAKYEEGKAQFTISFDTDMKCIGFYIK